MLISKFYNSTNKSKQQQTNRANSRVLTPSSIPIFVLPPTLDNFNANASPKPELNDSVDCLNIKLADDLTPNSSADSNEPFIFQTNRKTSSFDSQIIRGKTTINNKLVKNASFHNENYTELNFDSNSLRSHSQITTSPNNNNNINNKINHTNSNHLRPSFKLKTNSFNNSPNQSPAQTPSQNNCVLKAFSDLQQLHNPNHEDENDLKTKENYCKTWLMDSNNSNEGTCSLTGRRSMNSSIKSNASNSTCSSYMLRLQNELTLNEKNNKQPIATPKQISPATSQAPKPATSTAVHLHRNHIDEEYLNKTKEEEKLQREYLVNLLKQLESEQESAVIPNQNWSMDETKRMASSLNKRTKRSKSETFVEMNVIKKVVPPVNGKTQIKSEHQQSDHKNLVTASTSNYSKKKQSHQLEPSEANESLGRFSLRNLFKLNTKSSQNMSQLINQSIQISSQTTNHSSKLSTPNATSLSRFSMSSISLNDSNNNIIMNHNQPKHYSESIASNHNSQNKHLSVLDLTSRVERLSNTNLDQLMNPLMTYHPGTPVTSDFTGNTSLLTIKRQSFKLSKKMNNHRLSLVDDGLVTDTNLDTNFDNDTYNSNDQNYNDDFEKAFNDFYTTNKIQGPNGIHAERRFTDNNITKARPRRSLFSKLFCSQNLKKSKQFVLLNDGDDENATNNKEFNYQFNLNNINLNSIEKEFKRNSVKEIIYMKLNKSLFTAGSQFPKTSTSSFSKSFGTNSFASVDIVIERLQQSSKNMHILTLNVKNLKVEPLFEINHVKARLTYYQLSFVNSQDIANDCSNDKKKPKMTTNSLVNDHHQTNKQKDFVKIHRLKKIKCKFHATMKHLQKPVEFELLEEHFLKVTDETTRLITQQQQTTVMNCGVDQTVYFFLFSIELHSYLPVSRMKLSSTFSKKKRIYRGHSRINENFIMNTQFCKKFDLNEI